jgi:hypothetical protein
LVLLDLDRWSASRREQPKQNLYQGVEYRITSQNIDNNQY